MLRIESPEQLITSKEQIRAGFISFALEKNRRSTPLIDSAKALKILASRTKEAKELLTIEEIQPALLTAAGLSDKAIKYFSSEDKKQAILELIENFLEPAGKDYIDEVVYRYLLIKGDALGGTMRNLIGMLAQQRLIRSLLSCLTIAQIDYQWYNNENRQWNHRPEDSFSIEERIKALFWLNPRKQARILAFNMNIPLVRNNVDICLFHTDIQGYKEGEIARESKHIIMLGELKGGIDPAGADEHWKTGNTALRRIRNAFAKHQLDIETSFVAAAIEKKMAAEIFVQLQCKELSWAANLTIDEQVVNYCHWILNL